MKLKNTRVYFEFIILSLAALALFSSCSKHVQIYGVTDRFIIQGVVWDYHTDTTINNVLIRYKSDSICTDALGYFKIELKDNQQRQKPDTLEIIPLKGPYLSKKIPLSRYLQFYTIQLKDTTKRSIKSKASKRAPSADMHYHLGLKGYNEYGNYMFFEQNVGNGNRDDLHRTDSQIKELQANSYLAWERRFDHLRVMDPKTGRWKKCLRPKMIKPSKVTKKKGRVLYQQYLGLHLRPKPGRANNTLYDYSQASLPLAKQGNVRLIFNSITPFEKDLAKRSGLRFVSTLGKTNAKTAWLKKIGTRDDFSEWDMFNQSYKLLKGQNNSGVLFGQDWKFLNDGSELVNDSTTTYVVNVIEGAHALKDDNVQDDERLIKSKSDNIFITLSKNRIQDYNFLDSLERKFKSRDKLLSALKTKLVQLYGVDTLRSIEMQVKRLVFTKDEQSLIVQIDSLKKMNPPIFMVTIGHLSNNNMLDHAPALDANGLFFNVIRRSFNSRVSGDSIVSKTWDEIFNSILEVRRSGRILIDSLLSNKSSHRIYIDLKHSGFTTRKYVYNYLDSIARETQETIPPICSHCAATGMPEKDYSKFVNELALVKSQEVEKKKLYPLSINLYDEEIEEICKLNGIIGVTFEQRVLGGYLNSKKAIKSKKTPKNKRLNKTEEIKAAHVFRNVQPAYGTPTHYYDTCLLYPALEYGLRSKTDKEKQRLKYLLYQDYHSLKPFLNNLFYMLDKSTNEPDKKEYWKHFCIGSDMDGLIDPIDIAPTVAQYPYVQKRLVQFIPIFLMETNRKPENYYDIKNREKDLQQRVENLFYYNLAHFVKTYFRK